MTDRPSAPHGWIFLDDDGWEHDGREQHPHDRGEAEYATNFRPATAKEARSRRFFRASRSTVSFQTGKQTIVSGGSKRP